MWLSIKDLRRQVSTTEAASLFCMCIHSWLVAMLCMQSLQPPAGEVTLIAARIMAVLDSQRQQRHDAQLTNQHSYSKILLATAETVQTNLGLFRDLT